MRRTWIFVGLTAAVTIAAGAAHYGHATSGLTFALSTVALAGLAWIVSFSTEQVGERFGPGVTGVMQSTLGNLPEFFVVIFALSQGEVVVAQTSIIGSVFANALLVLGLVIIAGCPTSSDGVMRFSVRLPKDNAILLMLASFLIVILGISTAANDRASHHVEAISIAGAVALLVTYLVWIVDYLRSDMPGEPSHAEPALPLPRAARAARRRRGRRGVRLRLVHHRALADDGSPRDPEGVRRARDRRDRRQRGRERGRHRPRAEGRVPTSRSRW